MENMTQEAKPEELLAREFAKFIDANGDLFNQLLEQNQGSARNKLLDSVDRLLIDNALKVKSGNQTNTAAVLGMNRATLRNRIRDLNITGWRWRV